MNSKTGYETANMTEWTTFLVRVARDANSGQTRLVVRSTEGSGSRIFDDIEAAFAYLHKAMTASPKKANDRLDL